MKSYTMKDITRILGIKRTGLQQWIDRGYVLPSVQTAGGHGVKNLWSREDLFSLAIFQDLLKNGFTREEAADFMRTFAAIRNTGVAHRHDLYQELQEVHGIETFAVRVTSDERSADYVINVKRGELFNSEILALHSKEISYVKIANLTGVLRSVAKSL